MNSWTSGARRLAGIVVVLMLLATGVVLLRLGPDLPRSADDRPFAGDGVGTSGGPRQESAAPPEPGPEPDAATTTEEGASPVPTPSTETVAEPPSAMASLPETGPGLTEPGALLIATPLADGSVDVQEVVLLAGPTDSLVVAPLDLSGAGTEFADREAALTDLQVSAEGGPVVVPEAALVAPVQIDLPGAERVEANYRLHDTVVRSVPSTARRGLLAVGPALDLGELPVRVFVAGDGVLNLTCPLLPEVAERTCAAGAPPLVRAEPDLPASQALVVAQIDLPRV